MAQYVDLARIRQLVAEGASQRAIAKDLGISRAALQRLLHALKTSAPAAPTPALRQILRRLESLETALHKGQPPPSPQVPDDMSIRLSVHVPRSMVQQVKTLATDRKLSPSHLVQEALREWLAGQ